MCEIKGEYMYYEFAVEYTKEFMSGNLKGLKVSCFIKFIDIADAIDYVDAMGPGTGPHQDLCSEATWTMRDWSVRRIS